MKPTVLFPWIHSYGLMLAVGFYAAWWLAARRARAQGEDPEMIGNLVLIAIVAGVAGARLLYFWQYRKPIDAWWTLFKVWEGGHTQKRTIQVGLRGDVYVEIVDGLREGEQVIGE